MPEPTSPVRDERHLGPTEDLDRQPDGVPHEVVGLAALFSVMLAALALTLCLTGSVGRIAAVLICLAAIPALVGGLRTRAHNTRDRHHPSV